MSAFVCNPKTVGVIAKHLTTYFAPFEINAEKATAANFAEEMAVINLQSVAYRYKMTPEKTAQDFMGQSVAEYIQECRAMADSSEVAELEIDLGRLWGAVSCWLYQSCEFEWCVNSEVYKTVQEFESILEHRCQRIGLQCEGWELH